MNTQKPLGEKLSLLANKCFDYGLCFIAPLALTLRPADMPLGENLVNGVSGSLILGLSLITFSAVSKGTSYPIRIIEKNALNFRQP